ncbi:MAG: hypothetical protein ACRDYA_08845 [Egibacteraceae bacterium]
MVSGRTALQLLSAFQQAISAGLLGAAGERVTFRHELVRAAIYEDLPLPLRQGLHREAGATCSGPSLGTPRRWSGSAELPARRLPRPARGGRAAGTGVELTRPTDHQRGALVAELAPSLIQTGRAADVEPLARQVLARLPEPAVESALRRALGEVLWVQGRLETATAQFEAAAAITGVPEPERASALAMVAHLELFLSDVDGARLRAAQDRKHGARLGNDFVVGLALKTLAVAAGTPWWATSILSCTWG